MQGLFIAATGQNVGKTTLCLGILAALHKRIKHVGFIKPVGQQHIQIDENLKVDKDVILFKEYFNLKSPYADMSPVILPAGFTRAFLDEKIQSASLEQSIRQAFANISQQHGFTIAEGTGHTGVGSIIELNNARVASILGLEVVIIASGGLGSALDELALNLTMCRAYGVNVRGIILNKVLEDKRAMIENYFPKALKPWNVPLIGCVPYNAFLNTPTLKDFETLFQTSLIAGEDHHYRHYQNPRLVAGSLTAFEEEVKPGELIITPASREDIILSTLKRQKRDQELLPNALILTGRHTPRPFIVEQIKKMGLPALYAPLCSYDAMKMITSFTAKIRGEDIEKIEEAIRLVEDNLDLSFLLPKHPCLSLGG